jgi:RNA polymerase sigma factor (sigma-70 family)
VTLYGDFLSLTELIEAVIAENERAQEVLFETYGPSIHGYIRRYLERNRCVQPDQDSCDVAIEVWCKALDPTILRKLRNYNAFVTWLYRVARNDAIAHLTKCTRYRLVDLGVLDSSAQSGQPLSIEKMLETGDEFLNIMAIARTISWKLYTILSLKRVGYSTAEIANCLRITEENVRTTISRGLVKIRRKLEPGEDGNQRIRKRISGK